LSHSNLPDRGSFGDILGTVGKPSARKGAWALIRGVWTYNGKVIEFQSFSMNKKIRGHTSLTGTLLFTKELKKIKHVQSFKIEMKGITI